MRWALVAWVAIAACTNESDREAGDVCENVGFAIASRTLACSGDPELANARFERFQLELTCAAPDVSDVHFACVRSVNARTCEDVGALADDLPRWISTSSACPALFEGPTP